MFIRHLWYFPQHFGTYLQLLLPVTQFNRAKLVVFAFSDYNFAENSYNLRSPDFQDFCFYDVWMGGEFVPPSIYPSYEHTDANAQTSTQSRSYWWWKEAVQLLCQSNNDCKPFCVQFFQLNCPPVLTLAYGCGLSQYAWWRWQWWWIAEREVFWAICHDTSLFTVTLVVCSVSHACVIVSYSTAYLFKTLHAFYSLFKRLNYYLPHTKLNIFH